MKPRPGVKIVIAAGALAALILSGCSGTSVHPSGQPLRGLRRHRGPGRRERRQRPELPRHPRRHLRFPWLVRLLSFAP